MRTTTMLVFPVLLLTPSMLGAAAPNQFTLSAAPSDFAAVRPVADPQSSVQGNGAKKPSPSDKKRAKKDANPQTFTGIVEWEYKPQSWDCDVPNCDHFALYDDVAKANYEIDDARAALPFEGKRAKVTGVLDAKTSTIHLRSIEGVQ